MKRETKKERLTSLTLIIICIGIATVLLVHLYSLGDQKWWNELEAFEDNLTSSGITIQKGEIQSPAVIIAVETEEEFKAKIDELNATIIYVEYYKGSQLKDRHYYVFTEEFAIAYRYIYEYHVELDFRDD